MTAAHLPRRKLVQHDKLAAMQRLLAVERRADLVLTAQQARDAQRIIRESGRG